MKTLEEYLNEADRRGVALAHFNVSELTAFNAVTAVARELTLPVLIGVSEGERQFIGVKQVAALVQSVRQEFDQPVFLNADHTHSIEGAVAAAKAGFDLIVFDASTAGFSENVAKTKEVVRRVKKINPSILVEGELGFIGTSSSIHEKAPENLSPLTTPEDAGKYAEQTQVDILAPAVGTIHGLLETVAHGRESKKVDVARIREIKEATGAYLTLHGGSGTSDHDFGMAIEAGVDIVHINTELRLVWRDSLKKAFEKHPKEIVPYRLLSEVVEMEKDLIRNRMRLFWKQAKAA